MSDALGALIVRCAEHRAQALVVFIALWTAVYGLVEALLAARGFSFDFKASGRSCTWDALAA